MKRYVFAVVALCVILPNLLISQNNITSFELEKPHIAAENIDACIYLNDDNASIYEQTHPEFPKYLLIEGGEFLIGKPYGIYVNVSDYVIEIRGIVGIELSTGIFVDSAIKVILKNNEFINTTNGIVIKNTNDSIVENNLINGTNIGIYLYHTSNGLIKGTINKNIIIGGVRGISISLGIFNVEDNKIYNSEYGFYIGGTGLTESVIQNNYFENNSYSMSLGQIRNSEIQNNVINNSNTGIYITGSSEFILIKSNKINTDDLTDNFNDENFDGIKIIEKSYGILLSGGADHNLVLDNHIAADNPIFIWNYCKFNNISLNALVGYSCISDSGINTTISENKCKELSRPKTVENEIVEGIDGYTINWVLGMAFVSVLLILKRKIKVY